MCVRAGNSDNAAYRNFLWLFICLQQIFMIKKMCLCAGSSDNAAYLANVCVAESARRQGVGGALVRAARQQARDWGKVILCISTTH